MLDYIIFRQSDVDEARNNRAMRGADCRTDHVILRSRVMFKRKMQHNDCGSQALCRLGTGLLKDQKTKEKHRKEMNETLELGWPNYGP